MPTFALWSFDGRVALQSFILSYLLVVTHAPVAQLESRIRLRIRAIKKDPAETDAIIPYTTCPGSSAGLEREPSKLQVTGSSPVRGTMHFLPGNEYVD
jgi:hypothetical protein